MAQKDFERLIIKSLYSNESISNKILPMFSYDWFDDELLINISNTISTFFQEHERIPNVLETKLLLKNNTSALNEFEECLKIPDEEASTDFILTQIEEFIQKKKLFHAARDIVEEIKKPGKVQGGFADKISECEAFTFDESIGTDFMNDVDEMYDTIIENERVFKTGLKTLDILLGGGLHEKSITILLAETNLGKTLSLCSLAAGLITNGYNVLYVTFEDPEKKIAKRILQNILNTNQKELKSLTKEQFKNFFINSTKNIKKNLIIKEYPEYTCNAITINTLLKNLEEKKKFKPEVIIIDYVGCMIPNVRNNSMNTNSTLQHITGEVRAIGMAKGIAILSVAQTNRGANGTSDLRLDDSADSYGQNFKADAVLGITQPPACIEACRYLFKLIKTRFDGEMKGQRRYVGVDISKQRLFDVMSDEELHKSITFGNNNISPSTNTAQVEKKDSDKNDWI